MTDPHDALSGFLRKLGHLRARANEGPPEEAAARECLWVEFSRLTRLVAPTSSHPEGLPLAASTDERSEVRFESWSFAGLDIECEWLPSDMLRVMLAPRVRGALVSVECAAQGGPFAEVASSTTSGGGFVDLGPIAQWPEPEIGGAFALRIELPAERRDSGSSRPLT